MNIKEEQVLQEIRFKNKTFLCQIRVVPRAVKYFHGQETEHLTQRWMLPEHWAGFDAGLEEILTRYDKGRLKSLKEDGEHFQLSSVVRVRVQATRTPVEALCRCTSKNQLLETDVALALECIIEYDPPDGKWNSGPYNQQGTIKELVDKPNDQSAAQEYKPQPINVKEKDREKGEEYDPQAGNVESYIPYTPTTIEEGASLDIGEDGLEPYTLTTSLDSSPDKLSQSPNSNELVYKPTPIKKANNDAKSTEHTFVEEKTQSHQESSIFRLEPRDTKKRTDGDETKISFTAKETYMRNYKEVPKACISNNDKNETECDLLEKEIMSKCARAPFETKNNDTASKETNNDGEDSQRVVNDGCLSATSDKRRKCNYEKQHVCTPMPKIRRSARSPNKPKRLIEVLQIDGSKQRPKSTLPAKKNKLQKELFGSDDEIEASDMDDFVTAAPSVKFARTLPESRFKNKRKREPLDDCAQEKRYINRWISTSSSRVGNGDQKSQGATPAKELYDRSLSPTKTVSTEEMKNKSKQVIVERKSEPSPVKVEMFSLENMTATEILNSLLNYKASLDKLFYKLQKEKRYRHGHNGINHCFVINLIDNDTQMQMLHKLRETYDENPVGSSGNATLYINVLLPEWVICIFMEKYNLTRDEAIKQIRAQEEYKCLQQD